MCAASKHCDIARDDYLTYVEGQRCFYYREKDDVVRALHLAGHRGHLPRNLRLGVAPQDMSRIVGNNYYSIAV